MDPTQLLTFLAGAGIGPLLDQVSKLMKGAGHGQQQHNPNTPSGMLPHRPGLRMGAGGPPGSATLAPSMLQALLQQTGAGQQQQNPQALLQALTQGGAGGV